MLATLLVTCCSFVPQDPPPTTGILSDQAFVVLPEGGSDLKYWEVDEYEDLQDYDSRYELRDIVSMPSALSFSSFSRGTGWMHMDYVSNQTDVNFVYPTVAGGWSFMTFTVSGSSFDTGTAYNDEMLASGSVAGDVFAYVVPGSEGFPDADLDVVHKVREGEDVPGGPVEYVDIDGFLGGMTMTDDYVTDFDTTASSSRVSFFFTVYNAGGVYTAIPDQWVNYDPDLRSAATIFWVTWSSGAWGPVSKWKSWQELGLERDDQITALSVMDSSLHYETNGIGPEVILSVAADDPQEDADKLLWVVGTWPLSSGTATALYQGPLATEFGNPFAVDKLNITPTLNRIRGSCVDDPFHSNAGISLAVSHDLWRRERMAFLEDDSVGSRDLSFSLHRQRVPVNLNVMRFRASLAGTLNQGDLFAQLQMSQGSGWEVVDYVPRNGPGKESTVFDLSLTGIQLGTATLRWAVFDQTAAMVGESHHFSILLRQ